jgi:hypothetical protein
MDYLTAFLVCTTLEILFRVEYPEFLGFKININPSIIKVVTEILDIIWIVLFLINFLIFIIKID